MHGFLGVPLVSSFDCGPETPLTTRALYVNGAMEVTGASEGTITLAYFALLYSGRVESPLPVLLTLIGEEHLPCLGGMAGTIATATATKRTNCPMQGMFGAVTEPLFFLCICGPLLWGLGAGLGLHRASQGLGLGGLGPQELRFAFLGHSFGDWVFWD